MPRIESWKRFPSAIRNHLIERMHERQIAHVELAQLRVWVESLPDVPVGDWYKDFGSFKICGRGPLPKTFLLKGQAAKGEAL
jgi:hypothetical protein